MAILPHPEGTQFCLQSYREQLTPKSASLLKAELRLLAQTNGQFVRLLRQSNGIIEAVFSRDAAYALGESVWHFCGRPRFLIYCEALEVDSILLVIIKHGQVHLDTIVSQRELQEELVTAFADHCRYVVKVIGDVAISDISNEHADYVIPRESLRSFERSQEPLFSALPAYEEYRLLPLEQAISEAKIERHSPKLALAAIVILAGFIWWFYPSQPEVVRPNVVSAFGQFQSALRAPSVKRQVQDLENMLLLGFSVPGWQVTKLDYQQPVTMELHSYGGSTHSLLRWAQEHHFNVDLTSHGAVVKIFPQLGMRTPPKMITPSINTLATIIDRMVELFPNQQVVHIENVRDYPMYRATHVTLTLSSASTAELGILREQLAGLPIKLQQAHINVNNGLFSGTINLTVIGS